MSTRSLKNTPSLDPHTRVQVLYEAVPYIQRFRDKVMVIKCGGRIMEAEDLKSMFVEDVILLHLVGIRPIVVHGGGKEIDRLLERLNLSVQKIRGRRVTSQEVLEVVEMVLSGTINKDLVSLFFQKGARAVGLSGKDGGLVLATQKETELGYVGTVSRVDPTILHLQIQGGFIPVVSPLGSKADGTSLNINADEVAAWLAVALEASKLILLTDVPGVRDESGWIETMGEEDLRHLLTSSAVEGGMIPKLECALLAIEKGVEAVHILDGTIPHTLLLELFTDHGVGTMIGKSQPLIHRGSAE